MNITRRRFIKTGALVTLAASVPFSSSIFAAQEKLAATQSGAKTGSFPIPYEASTDPTFNLTLASCASFLNTKFSFQIEPRKTISLTLVEINDLKAARGKRQAIVSDKECFSLVFAGSAKTPLPQGVYQLNHYALGKLSLLLVPVSRNQQRPLYEAVINRLYPS